MYVCMYVCTRLRPGVPLPFHGGGGIRHDQCILVDDMNHVAVQGEGRMDAEEPQTQGRRRRKDVPFHEKRAGELCLCIWRFMVSYK